MISLRTLPFIVSLVVSSVTAGINKSSESPCDEPKVTYWFSFGDSYTTTGFTWNSTLPNIGNPLGNPAFPGVTGGGGENYVGFDTVTYNKSLILSYDYGVGGAVIDPTLVAPITLALPDEITQFLEGAAKKPEDLALDDVWIGINDLGNTFYLNGSRSAFSDLLLERYFAQVQQLDCSRSLAMFDLVLSATLAEETSSSSTYRLPIGPLWCIIGFFPTQLDLLKTVIEGFNSKLATKVKAFQAQNHGVTTWVWDAYTAFNIILESPQKYGFVDNSSYGEPGDFWANTYHPSSPAHLIFAKEINQLLTGTPWF
ncbi:Carbohydrate esterase family 16 [Mycena sanguinolenta]|uniref:Carbohydrate esterase family 16 n=1 Tax=Mycena sanguinolenta TaxID=230812 RepID=A0A8H7CXZ1_9AGAR|nr:Carbohydrate esterase family 16 [Mycena sanguinolenta]